MPKVRRATHAGTWYTDDSHQLSRKLDEWLSKAVPTQSPARAIIAPHAGYYFCGACSAHAYRQVDPTYIKRIFILGPSHNVHLTGCALSTMEKYETPLYNLTIDAKLYEELYATQMFEKMKPEVDEDEHSLEMHLPYIAKVMQSREAEFNIVPVLVGALTPESEQMYGKIFSKYLKDRQNLFVISSDFCHWGRRFNYIHHDKKCGDICNSIKALDEKGMNIIERLEPSEFRDYLREYKNTICGRHPISVLINAASELKKNGNNYQMSLKFVQYAQSNHCKTMDDSSVSYASAALTISDNHNATNGNDVISQKY